MTRTLTVCLTVFVLAGCWEPECSNQRIVEVVSPDGTKKMVLFSRNCGATTDFNTQGTMLNRGDVLPNAPGTAFILDSGSANVAWEGDSKVVVTLDANVRVFKRELSDGGIAIEYRNR